MLDIIRVGDNCLDSLSSTTGHAGDLLSDRLPGLLCLLGLGRRSTLSSGLGNNRLRLGHTVDANQLGLED